jgi:hypothetical protein
MPMVMAGHLIAAALRKAGVKNVERPKNFKAALELLKKKRQKNGTSKSHIRH